MFHSIGSILISASVWFFTLTLLTPSGLSGQTTAEEWFEAGISATTYDQKIQAFKKAVQLDGDYVEAYFYLGLAYKSKQRYAEAEAALNRAYFNNPYLLNDDIKARILLELGSVYAILGKYREAEDALKGAKGLSGQNDTIRGRICYELGEIYLQQDRIDEALKYLTEGKPLLPQQARQFEKALQLANSKKYLDGRYKQGLTHLREERYREAVAIFRDIIRRDIDFRDTQLQLELAVDGLNRQTKPADPPQSAAPPEIIVAENQPESSEALPAEVQRKAGAEAETTEPPTQRSATPPIQRSAEEERLVALYDAGLAQIQQENWAAAFEHFKQLKILAPRFRDIDAQLIQIREALKQGQRARADSLFQQGTLALQNGDWRDAVAAFEKVKSLDPAYDDIENKLADARFNLERSMTADSQPAGNSVAVDWTKVATVIAVFLLLLVAVTIVFSPTIRARLHRMRGQYNRAAEIYENILRKHPDKTHLYPLLVNIYFLQNRRDEQVMKIYETIIKRNLQIPQRKQINTIVANYYLLAGRKDATAIAVMEKELDSKLETLSDGS